MKLVNVKTAPCGCRIGDVRLPNGESAFGIEPCALNCNVYRYVLRETREQDKPVYSVQVR